jgi:hypothetical protein
MRSSASKNVANISSREAGDLRDFRYGFVGSQERSVGCELMNRFFRTSHDGSIISYFPYIRLYKSPFIKAVGEKYAKLTVFKGEKVLKNLR